LKFVKWLLVIFILVNTLLVFVNVINPIWAVTQINHLLESTKSSERLLNQETIKNTPGISLGGEVSTVIETQASQKN
jgi:hypothetical protein